jgi:hypothetical protein
MWSKTKMKKAWVALGASALAIVLVASTFDTAEARRGGGGGGWRGGGGHYSARSFSAPRFVARSSSFARVAPFRHHRHVRRAFVGAPLAYGAYAYSYGSGCSWLRYRALETGSRYWWSRYYDCVNGYY